MRLFAMAALTISACHPAALGSRPIASVASVVVTCDAPSTVPAVAAVQRSAMFTQAVRPIATTSYPDDRTAFAVEFQRICRGLRLWQSPALPGLRLVSGVAFQTIVEISVVFAVGRGWVELLNRTPGDSLDPGLDVVAWNTRLTPRIRIKLVHARAAIAMACVIHALQEIRWPDEACGPEVPVSSAARHGAGWRISLPDATITLDGTGRIESDIQVMLP